jgi:hypothetical protein
MTEYEAFCAEIRAKGVAAEGELTKCMELKGKADDAIESYTLIARSARHRLGEVKKALAHQYALRLLNEFSEEIATEIESLESRVRELEQAAEYGPLILGHLEKIAGKNFDQFQAAQTAVTRLERLEIYEALKQELRKTFSETRMEKLKSVSGFIDSYGLQRMDLDAFLIELEKSNPRVLFRR